MLSSRSNCAHSLQQMRDSGGGQADLLDKSCILCPLILESMSLSRVLYQPNLRGVRCLFTVDKDGR